nr:hypothetical protein [Tanacetum cinerariifolium]
MPRGTTKVVTRGRANDCLIRCRYEVHVCGSRGEYEDTPAHRGESSSSTNSSSFEVAALAQQMTEMRKDILQTYRSNQQVNSMTPSCETCGGPHSYYGCQAAGAYTQDVNATTRKYNSGILTKALQERPHGAFPSNTIPNPRKEIKALTTQSGIILYRPSVPLPLLFSTSKDVERDPETITDQ